MHPGPEYLRGIIGPSEEDKNWAHDPTRPVSRVDLFLHDHPVLSGIAGVLGIVSIAELVVACTQPPAIIEATTTPLQPIPTETPRPTPTLTPEPTPSPEPKVERNPFPPYGVFPGTVFKVDETTGAKTQIGKIVIASIPQTEQGKPETIFFYYISNTRQLKALQLPITKIEGNRVVAIIGNGILDVTLIQPGIGKDVKPVLRGEMRGEKIEATQVGTCKETLERAIKSMKNQQLKLGLPEWNVDSVNISELAEQGIIFPNVCPVPKLSSFNPLT